jgi:4a-hydroxytetrahydrobiopterin dehydratase
MALSEESCVPCRDGEPMAPADVSQLWKGVPGWSVASRGEIKSLRKSFSFPDFAAALAFANRVGAMADAQDHHPEITVGWGEASVSWWTHRIKGLHRNDFICAAKTDALFRG